MDVVVEALITSGVAGIVVGLVLVFFLKPAIETLLKHNSDTIIERLKTESTVVAKRYDAAERGVAEMQQLLADIESHLRTLPVNGQGDFLGNLIRTVHPVYRRRYQAIRSNFETSNDVISAYSLEYEHLTHPKSIESLIVERAGLRRPGDIKYAYRKIWMTSLEGMRALLRVTSGYRFWEPVNYAERAQKWAEFDRQRTEEFLIGLITGPNRPEQNFYLLMELKGAQEAFWTTEVEAWANKALKPAVAAVLPVGESVT